MAIIKHSRTNKNTRKKTIFYEAQIYVRGVRVTSKSFETQAEASTWHDEGKKQYLHGQIVTNEVREMTFSDVFVKYRSERVPQLRLSTQQTMGNRFKYLLESPIFNTRMCDFSDRTIDVWFEWLRKHPTASDPGRKNFKQEFILFRAVLYWYRDCINAGFVVPVVKRHRKAIFFKPVKPRRPDYFMRKEEIQLWIDWLKTHRHNQSYYRLATFMVLTATRVGEAAGLFWDAVDFKNDIATIIRTVWWDHHTKAPNVQEVAKTKESIRIIKLSPTLLEMLRVMKEESKGEGPIFTDSKGGVLRYPAIQNAFNSGFVALKLPWRSTHICRHSFGTLALVATRDLSSVQAAMGHRNIQETQGYAKIVALLDGVTANKTADYIGINL